ncbi:MAG: hypothetical protein GY795_47160 [Desulfobacterales bacterium]|nr:hypothetical protein [Desulfobacterales bacterium]
MEKWLESPNTMNVLSNVARSVMKSVISKKLSLCFFDITDRHGEHRDFSEDIRSELILFMLENEFKIQNVLFSENKNCHHYLKKAFINYCIAKSRRSLTDPRRYLYKHTADVLRDSEKFYTFAGNNRPMAFSMASECIAIPSLLSEDIKDIVFPDQTGNGLKLLRTAEHINKKKNLLALAEYFWNKVCGMWENKPVRVELRDFTAWIGLHVSITARTPVKYIPDGNTDLNFLPDHRPGQDTICFNPELVKNWAWNFFNRLNKKEKTVFLLRHGHNLSLKNIAEKLGYKGSSGPKYPLEKAEQKLKFFLCDLPWLSPDDLNDEAFALFRDTLLQILETDSKEKHYVQPYISNVPGQEIPNLPSSGHRRQPD